MKKIFQWQEYLDWKNLTPRQKINFKRAVLFPFFVYLVYSFLSEFSYAILILIGVYFLIRFINKNKLSK